ncbi:hypothetical protein KIN20_001836 [Parelaphostrongylus tenuis]|uniref:Uncharacterized protein n=1 Tax=Parelaphostrongylus tenuis TaxID=148309 RepID=A0AAD5LWT7_PARTN|nr:hypothetical protein KIN20_001836 [Parelaphostrongylus tenuis]
MKFTVEGREQQLAVKFEQKYGDAFKSACDAMGKALEIIRSPDFIDRETWKVVSSIDHVTVHSKDINGLRCFAAKTNVDVPAYTLCEWHWNHLASVNDFKNTMKSSWTAQKLSDNIDLAHEYFYKNSNGNASNSAPRSFTLRISYDDDDGQN